MFFLGHSSVHTALFSIESVEALLSSFIGSLGVVLLIDFLIRLVVRHRPRPYEKLLSTTCWMIGCLASVMSHIYFGQNDIHPLIVGMLTSALSFLILVFFEETFWSIRKLSGNRQPQT